MNAVPGILVRGADQVGCGARLRRRRRRVEVPRDPLCGRALRPAAVAGHRRRRRRGQGCSTSGRLRTPPPQPAHLPEEPPWTSADGLDCLTINVHTPGPDGGPRPVSMLDLWRRLPERPCRQPPFDERRWSPTGTSLVTFNCRVGFEDSARCLASPTTAACSTRWPPSAGYRRTSPASAGTRTSSRSSASRRDRHVDRPGDHPQAAGLFRRGIAQSVPGVFFSPELAMEVTAHVARAAELSGGGAGGGGLARLAPERLVMAGRRSPSRSATAPNVRGSSAMPTRPSPRWSTAPSSPSPPSTRFAMEQPPMSISWSASPETSTSPSCSTRVRSIASANGMSIARSPRSDCRRRRASSTGRLIRAWTGRSCTRWSAPTRSSGFRASAPPPTIRGVGRRTDVSLRVRLALPHRRRTAGRPPFHRRPVRVRDPRQSLRPSLARARPRSGAEDLSRRLRRAWARFAATGDPGWPAYRPDEPLALVWDVEDTIVHDPEAASSRIWRSRLWGGTAPFHGVDGMIVDGELEVEESGHRRETSG